MNDASGVDHVLPVPPLLLVVQTNVNEPLQ